jgi:6-phosphogluconolactonase (cycloisomerase 2 family)
MRTRLAWILALLALVSIGALIACSTKYSSSSNGLVVIPSQAGGPQANSQQNGPVMETFSLDLANGHVSEINNVNGPPAPGLPGAVVLDPAGANAYVIVTQNPAVPGGGATGIAAFPVASDGKLGTGTTTTLNTTAPTVTVVCVTLNGPQDMMVQVLPTPVAPNSLVIDSAGKFLFVADVATSGQTQPYTCNGATVTSTVPVPGTVSVFAVSSGTLTEAPGSPFALPTDSGASTSSASALDVTPTMYPLLYSYCSGFPSPTTENLYVTDSVNFVLLNFLVSSTGSLTPVPTSTTVGVPTGSVPSGVTVDPCNRFVYVSNAGPGSNANTVSAYTICSTVSLPNCPTPNYSLLPVKGSPFVVSPGDNPGPLTEDAYGSYLYVVDTGSNVVSQFRLSPTTGSLTPLTPPTVGAGQGANSIAVRNDDTWVFVANITAATLSQFAITPSTGALVATPQPISTFNLPSGVAVTRSPLP